MANKDTLVFYPSVLMGHLVPMVELAKLFLPHHFDIAIVLMHTPTRPTTIINFLDVVSANFPSISIHQLPPHSFPLDHPDKTVNRFENRRHNNENLRKFISLHSSTCKVRAVILDFFCTDALDVVAEFSLPSYFFFTSGAYDLAAFIYLPSFQEIGDELLEFPGCPPIPANQLPSEMKTTLVHHFNRLPEADGILVNTFESLEQRAVQALCTGLCTPGRITPPVFCIGPLISGEKAENHECIEWLDLQPRNSVVFLCFGSMGPTFKAEQLEQIAKGLEASQQRFLWVVRAPPGNELAELDLKTLLPAGFLERTKNRGMVVKKWAPQTAVLGHEAVGGFVTHCGWNSILESVVNGVPMIAWPLYAEQKMNKVFLVEEMKLAVGIEGYDEEVVMAEEVEEKVRWLMASEDGKELREKTKKAMREAAEARKEGGSASQAFMKLIMELELRV